MYLACIPDEPEQDPHCPYASGGRPCPSETTTLNHTRDACRPEIVSASASGRHCPQAAVGGHPVIAVANHHPHDPPAQTMDAVDQCHVLHEREVADRLELLGTVPVGYRGQGGHALDTRLVDRQAQCRIPAAGDAAGEDAPGWAQPARRQ